MGISACDLDDCSKYWNVDMVYLLFINQEKKNEKSSGGIVLSYHSYALGICFSMYVLREILGEILAF